MSASLTVKAALLGEFDARGCTFSLSSDTSML
jgi:hypothetical protein